MYSATLDEEEFDFDEEKDDSGDGSEDKRSRKDVFLKSIEEKLDPTNKEHKERFQEIKNQILEKVKATQISRARSRSGSVKSRSNSQKRDLSVESLGHSGKSPPASRPRTMLPVKQQ